MFSANGVAALLSGTLLPLAQDQIGFNGAFLICLAFCLVAAITACNIDFTPLRYSEYFYVYRPSGEHRYMESFSSSGYSSEDGDYQIRKQSTQKSNNI